MTKTEEVEKLKYCLKQNNLSYTTQRLEVFRCLLTSETPLQPAAIYARTKGRLNLSSVYRALSSLEAAGCVKMIPSGFKSKYEVSEIFKPHHHHVHCDECGVSEEIDSLEIEDSIERIVSKCGFKAKSHIFEVRGVCRSCLASRGAATEA